MKDFCLWFVVIGLVAACSSTTSEGKSCETASECGASVCVRVDEAASCVPRCSVGGNDCSGEASCQGVGSLSVNVCVRKQKAATASDPPEQKEQPRLPCKTDTDCTPLDSRAICAQWHGRRDCTIPCTSDDVCTEPEIAGVAVNFESCQSDEGNTARRACLPRAECESDPRSCVSYPGSGGSPSGGTGGVDPGAPFP